ncbi:MAG: 30S ribosomal protein S15 [Chitinophagaceae bacterium]|jgi:small subunit ribosomal protein S15|nr:MAG: 30S ribosomal protein S15 [Chitinophagaceae bacterium]
MSYLTKEKKQEIFKDFGGSEMNTGSVEGQVALLTFRISSLTDHLKKHRKDFSTTQALNRMVGKRKRLLKYLQRRNLEGYRKLIEDLKLRR